MVCKIFRQPRDIIRQWILFTWSWESRPAYWAFSMQAGSIINTAMRIIVLDLEFLSLQFAETGYFDDAENPTSAGLKKPLSNSRGLCRKELLIVIQPRPMTEPPTMSCLFDIFVKSLEAMISGWSQNSGSRNTLLEFRHP